MHKADRLSLRPCTGEVEKGIRTRVALILTTSPGAMVWIDTTLTVQSAMRPTASDIVAACELPDGDSRCKYGSTCGRNDMICHRKHAMFLKPW
jgi:hypothetical protein